MRRVAMILSVVSLAVALSAIATAPAHAGSGGTVSPATTTGSCSSTGCQLQLRQMVTFSGSYSQGTTNTVVDVAPPPCLWVPIGDATTGSKYIISQFGSNPKTAPASFAINSSVQQADQLLKAPQPGEWYNLPINPAAGTAGAQECLKLPAFYFVPPAGQLPGVNIPPRTLAQLAFAGLNPPTLSSITTNPTGATKANLPTYVQVTVGASATGQLGVTPEGRPYVWVTAHLGNEAATVWVESSALNINAGTSQATTYDAADCSVATMSGQNAMLGSQASPLQMSQTAAGQSIDCGVTYQAPGTYNLTASVGWTACWAPTANNAPPTYAQCQANKVPGAGNLAGSTFTRAIDVQEIQSVNGG